MSVAAAKTRPPKGPLKIKPTPEPSIYKVIRDPDFAKRLDQACDGHSHVPPKHSGRLTWVQRELSGRFDEDVSVETVRKWFAGEAKPRPDKLAKIAQLLEVDVAWLSLGIDPSMAPRERKVRNAMVDGAVNLVAGLIQMDGGHPAFPVEGDKAAQKNHVDLHAIIKGAKYDLHISLGEQDGKNVRFSVPTTYEAVVVLGVVKDGFNIQIVEIPAELIEAGERHGGSITVVMDEAVVKSRRVESFKTRL